MHWPLTFNGRLSVASCNRFLSLPFAFLKTEADPGKWGSESLASLKPFTHVETRNAICVSVIRGQDGEGVGWGNNVHVNLHMQRAAMGHRPAFQGMASFGLASKIFASHKHCPQIEILPIEHDQ